MKFPVKLSDEYPCRGVDAEGDEVFFDDLLNEGDTVAGQGEVVRNPDGLWIEEVTDVVPADSILAWLKR
jgi:hypothetical protein